MPEERTTNQPAKPNAAAGQPQAVLYLRTASGKQADRDMATVVQQHLCQWRAHELGATVVAEFVDFGSGLGIERPGLTDLLAKVTELHAVDSRRQIYVVAADHARIARSIEAYSRVSWALDQAGAVLNIASIPLVAYEALSGLSLGEYADRWPRPPSIKPHPRRKEQPPTNQED